MKWEKWDQMDYTRCNLVGPSPLHEEHLQEVGIPLRFVPEAPKLKKTWVKKEGPMGDFFKDFVSQLAQQFIHTQLDKLTNDVHRRVVTGVDADSKRVVVHCDFAQDLAHAMADQSMCEYFDIISSSLFIAVVHFWDPVTNKRECEGVVVLAICLLLFFFKFCNSFFYWVTVSSGWVFISDNTSHSNNHVNHYLQQIHEHYDAYYVQNDFGHIAVLTVWADNCSEQFKSRYQLGWSVLYVNKTTLQVIHLFFFCPQHGKGPPDGLGGNCKNAVRAEEKFRRHLPAAIDVFLWLQSNFTAVHSPGIGLFSIRKRIFRFVPTGLVPRHHIIESTEFNGISNQYAFGVVKGAPIGRVFHRFIPSDCELNMVGSFKEQLKADIEDLLDTYRWSQ